MLTKLLGFDFSQYADTSASGIDNPMSVVHHSPTGSIEVMTSNTVTDDRVRMMHDRERHLAASEWRRLADIIDRLLMIIYIAVVVSLSLGYLHYL